jgi:hypothetical protein
MTSTNDFHTFHNVISLGSSCLSALALQRCCLRQFSSPLDWIISSPRIAAHAIEDNWKTFLDSNMYIDLGTTNPTEPFVGHVEYSTMVKNGKTNVKMFLHRNPITQDGHEYYERTVSRFQAVCLAPSTSTLFVLVQSSKHRSKHHQWVKQFHDLFRVLLQTMQGRFELLVIRLQKATSKTDNMSLTEETSTLSPSAPFSTEMELKKSTDGKGSLLRVVYLIKSSAAGMEDNENLDRIISVVKHERKFEMKLMSSDEEHEELDKRPAPKCGESKKHT